MRQAARSPSTYAGRTRRKSRERVELERLRRDNERLTAELARTKAALDVVGKRTRSWDALRERGADARRDAEQVVEESFAELAPQVGSRSC